MTKAEEFEEKLNLGPLAESGIRSWCYDNRDLIARALRRDNMLERIDALNRIFASSVGAELAYEVLTHFREAVQ